MSLPRTHRPSTAARSVHRGATAALAAGSTALLVAGFVATTTEAAYAADAAVGLGTASSFAILAGSTITNTGASVISGDVGLSPGSSITGFPPALVLGGTQHISDGVAQTAKSDLVTAYNDAAGRPTAADVTDQDLGGMTLTPGVYEASTTMALTGTLTLNAQGNPSAVFIFKAGTALLTATGSRVQFINGGSSCNVFWQVGSSATLGTATRFLGTIMTLTSATLDSTASVEGRVLARNGAVTLDTNVITAPDCDPTPPTGGADPTASTGADPTASTGADGSDGSGGSGGSGNEGGTGGTGTGGTTPSSGPTPGPSKTPVIPDGRPDTGAVATQRPAGALYALAGLMGCAAAVAGGLALRRNPAR